MQGHLHTDWPSIRAITVLRTIKYQTWKAHCLQMTVKVDDFEMHQKN